MRFHARSIVPSIVSLMALQLIGPQVQPVARAEESELVIKTAGEEAKPEAKDVRAMISAIDKAAKRGIIHKNAANRRKARLNQAHINARKRVLDEITQHHPVAQAPPP